MKHNQIFPLNYRTREVAAYKIFINYLQRTTLRETNLNPPHISMSSSELSPQSSLPSHTHVWSLHKVLLQMNSSARQKKAPAITRTSCQDFYTVTHLEECIQGCRTYDSKPRLWHDYNDRAFHIMIQAALDHLASQILSQNRFLSFISSQVFHRHYIWDLYLGSTCSQLIIHILFSVVCSFYIKCFEKVHTTSLLIILFAAYWIYMRWHFKFQIKFYLQGSNTQSDHHVRPHSVLPWLQFSSSLWSMQSNTSSQRQRRGIQWARFRHRNSSSLHSFTQPTFQQRYTVNHQKLLCTLWSCTT